MADLRIEPVGAQIQPVQPMSLAQMVDMARGAQAYQQAQQMNPLAIQKAQADVQTAQIGAESNRMKLAQDQISNISRRLTSLINDPLVIAAEQNPEGVDKAKLMDIVQKYAQEQGKSLGIPEDRIRQIGAPYLENAEKDPGSFRNFLKQKLLTELDHSSKITTLGGVGVSTQPQQAAPRPATPGEPPAAGAPTLRLPYPVRSAATPFIPEPSETKDFASGQEYRNSIVNRQGNLATDRRNVQEALKQVESIESSLLRKEGGIVQDIERKIRVAVNSDEYKLLAKDLANLQLTNMRTLGNVGDTVAGINLTKVANGDETIPPKVLNNIIRRTQADMTNIDMQANGVQKFSQKYGDNNVKAFQQAWNNNAKDTRIFEAINLMNEIKDPKKLETSFEKLFPSKEEQIGRAHV